MTVSAEGRQLGEATEQPTEEAEAAEEAAEAEAAAAEAAEEEEEGAAEEGAFRIRRGMRLAELRTVRRGDAGRGMGAAGEARTGGRGGASGEVERGEEEEEEEEEGEGDEEEEGGRGGEGGGKGGREGGGSCQRSAGLLRALPPLSLSPEDRVFTAAGARGEVQKNWVAWLAEAEGGEGGEGGEVSLHFSYSLEPHLVLQASVPQAATMPGQSGASHEETGDDDLDLDLDLDGGDGGDSPGDSLEVEARLVHSSRFAAAAESNRQHWPLMRGGTNAVSLGGGRYLAIMHTVHKREQRSLYQLAAYTFAAAPPHAVLAMGQPFGTAAPCQMAPMPLCRAGGVGVGGR